MRSHADWRKRIDKKNARAGTSAPTLAAVWAGPVELFGALESAPALAGALMDKIVVEAQSSFDELRGGRRNHDLVVHARLPNGERLVVCVEAKADEDLGQTIAGCRLAVERKQTEGEKTNAGGRLDDLLLRFVPLTPSAAQVLKLRYQLLTALAGMVAEAEKEAARHAVLMIHEFLTDNRAGKNLDAHELDLRRFATIVFDRDLPGSDTLPWCVRLGSTPAAPGVNLYLARAVTDLRTATLEQYGYYGPTAAPAQP